MTLSDNPTREQQAAEPTADYVPSVRDLVRVTFDAFVAAADDISIEFKTTTIGTSTAFVAQAIKPKIELLEAASPPGELVPRLLGAVVETDEGVVLVRVRPDDGEPLAWRPVTGPLTTNRSLVGHIARVISRGVESAAPRKAAS